jgi:contractile injection system tube protein
VERVAFLIESSGARLSCLLNPEMLVLRRTAGIRPRRSAAGQLTGAALADDPLLHSGGGRTVVDLDLLFDVSLAGSNVTTEDVRDLTSPLWNLAENAVADDGFARPTLVRFVWGKSWNIPGVVAAVAERLENFTPEGLARRSWLRLRLVRVGEPIKPTPAPETLVGPAPSAPTAETLADLPPEELSIREVGGGEGPAGAERIDGFLARNQIDPRFYKLILALNGIADPFLIEPGTQLRLPPPAMLEGAQ